MIARWEQGRTEIDALLERHELDRVPANLDLAHTYLTQARAHVSLARHGLDTDAVGSFQLAYDGARKALASLLVAQGLRPTSRGGHVAVQDAVAAQFGSVLGDLVRNFAWMRRIRNTSEYPSAEHPVASLDEAATAQDYAVSMIDAAERLVDQLPVY